MNLIDMQMSLFFFVSTEVIKYNQGVFGNSAN
jgi:hypothetical protein